MIFRRASSKLRMEDDKVRRKLLKMVAEGKVQKVREGASMQTPYLYFTDYVPIAGGQFEVAAPLIPVDMSSSLTGYGAQFSRFASLCMASRGR